MRCFVATFLTDACAARLNAAAAATLSHLHPHPRPVPRQNYHVTLKFLGTIDPDAVAEALQAVARLDAVALTGQVEGLAGFPRPAGARLVAAELAPHPILQGWWAALQDPPGGTERGFRPHVTVARLRRPAAVTAVHWSEPLEVALQPPALYRSDQTPEGVRYRPVTA